MNRYSYNLLEVVSTQPKSLVIPLWVWFLCNDVLLSVSADEMSRDKMLDISIRSTETPWFCSELSRKKKKSCWNIGYICFCWSFWAQSNYEIMLNEMSAIIKVTTNSTEKKHFVFYQVQIFVFCFLFFWHFNRFAVLFSFRENCFFS